MSDIGAQIAASRLKVSLAEYLDHEARDEHWCSDCAIWLPRRMFYADRRARRGVRPLCRFHELARRSKAVRNWRSGISYAGPAFSPTPTPEGAAASMPSAVAPEGHRTAVTYPDRRTGHLYCPSVLGCHEGRVPSGWVRSAEPLVRRVS